MPVSLYLTANNLAELRTAYLAKVVAIDLTAAAIARPTSVRARSNVFDAWRCFRTWRRRGDGSRVRLSKPFSSRASTDDRFPRLV